MDAEFDPIRLEIFKHLYTSIAEEMGAVLRKAAYSPNIKERRDFSCAVFDAAGKMVAQAAHIPVHLGSLPLSVQAAIASFDDLGPGDVIVLNDPFRGGTHLPDITMVSPVHIRSSLPIITPHDKAPQTSAPAAGVTTLIGYVASRAHHADVGGMTPGSMPIGREIYQEGLIIPPVRLMRLGRIDQGLLDLILANVRTPVERRGDLWAQLAANARGARRLADMAERYGPTEIERAMSALLAYTERMTRRLIAGLPDGDYRFSDRMDDDGIGPDPAPICVRIQISGDRARVDFSGSAPQQKGSVNAVYAITLSAVHYVFRCLLGLDIPNNAGCLAPIELIAPPGSMVNAVHPAPVAGGNVETSQRIVDVLLGALAQAAPERIPAASQGTMNNLMIGGFDPGQNRPFTYYETIAGGTGARPDADGPAAMHSHMTNTLNTPIEALEYSYPLRVMRYQVRHGSGGRGSFCGGDGLRRDIQLLVGAQVTILSERRRYPPYGLEGGAPGALGENWVIRDGVEKRLPGKGTFDLQAGDIISIRTPGGGGFGRED